MTDDAAPPSLDPVAVLRWHAENDIDTTEGAAPGRLSDWTGAPALTVSATPPPQAVKQERAGPAPVSAADAPMPKGEAVALATRLAARASSLDDLKTTLDAFKAVRGKLKDGTYAKMGEELAKGAVAGVIK